MIKKYWKYFLVGAIVFLATNGILIGIQNKSDAAIAQIMADRVMARHHAAVKRIRDTYAPLQQKATAKIEGLNNEIDQLSSLVDTKIKDLNAARKEISKLKNCPDQLMATNVLLDQSEGFILYLNNEYKIKVGALNLAWNYKFLLKQGELDDVLKENEKTILELGDAVKQAVMAKLKLKRRFGIGGFVGIAPDGKPTAGIGLTITIIKLPWRV
jgi:hypothetical protein